jgi:uncharacterized protein (TIRG00374 family)
MFSSVADVALVLRFLAGGTVNTVFGLAIILLLMAGGVEPVPANIAGYAAGVVLSFVVNRRFVFRAAGRKVHELARFIGAFSVSFLANLGTLQLLTRHTGVSPFVAQVVSIGVYVAVMFVLCRLFVFKVSNGSRSAGNASADAQVREDGSAGLSGSAVSTRASWKRNLAGIAISAACLGYVAWRIDVDDAVRSLAEFRWLFLPVALLSLASGYTMRVLRWYTMLRTSGAQMSRKACIAPLVGSVALNNVLPMRLGDVMRALVFPAAIGVARAAATGSLVMERLFDLMTLLACLAIGVVLSAGTHLSAWTGTVAMVLAAIGGTSLTLVFFFSDRLARWCAGVALRMSSERQARRRRVFAAGRDLLRSFDAMSRLPVLVMLFGYSALVWTGEAGVYWALLAGFGLEAGPATALIVMSIATLSTLVPSAPGYVGPFHLAAFAAISMLGGTQGQAASFAVLSHLALWLPTTLAGAIFILLNPRLFGRVKTEAALARPAAPIS